MHATDLPPVHDLDGRWSTGPADDLGHDRLSATPLRIEPWWGSRSPRLWLARRLFDYRHLKEQRGPGVRPWVLVGEEVGRGPDNEPLVACRQPVAWIEDAVLAECAQVVIRQRAGNRHRVR